MPIFEYECTECGEHTEHLQLSSGSPLSECPKCGGQVRKLMSAPAFQFKGTGWYVTDYAAKGKSSDGTGSSGDGDSKAAPESESKASSKSSDAGSSKSESKGTSTSGASPSSE